MVYTQYERYNSCMYTQYERYNSCMYTTVFQKTACDDMICDIIMIIC